MDARELKKIIEIFKTKFGIELAQCDTVELSSKAGVVETVELLASAPGAINNFKNPKDAKQHNSEVLQCTADLTNIYRDACHKDWPFASEEFAIKSTNMSFASTLIISSRLVKESVRDPDSYRILYHRMMQDAGPPPPELQPKKIVMAANAPPWASGIATSGGFVPPSASFLGILEAIYAGVEAGVKQNQTSFKRISFDHANFSRICVADALEVILNGAKWRPFADVQLIDATESVVASVGLTLIFSVPTPDLTKLRVAIENIKSAFAECAALPSDIVYASLSSDRARTLRNVMEFLIDGHQKKIHRANHTDMQVILFDAASPSRQESIIKVSGADRDFLMEQLVGIPPVRAVSVTAAPSPGVTGASARGVRMIYPAPGGGILTTP